MTFNRFETLYLRRADGYRIHDDSGFTPAQPGEVALIVRNVGREFHLDRTPVVAWADDDEMSTPVALLADCHTYCAEDFIGWALAQPDGMVSLWEYGRDRCTGRFVSIDGGWVLTTEAKWVERMKKTHAWWMAKSREPARWRR